MTGLLEAVVFDFDGVLVNSEPVHLRAYQEVLAEEGLSFSAHEYYGRYVGLDDEAVFAALQRDCDLPPRAGWASALIERKTKRVQQLLSDGSPFFPGAAELVRELAAAVPIAVASGALRDEITGVLRRGGLLDCFTAIVAAGETPRGKPHPDPYSTAVSELARGSGRHLRAGHTIGIEDTLQGLASARAAGLCTIAVTTTYAAGEMAGADAVVPSVAALSRARLEEIVGRRASAASDST